MNLTDYLHQTHFDLAITPWSYLGVIAASLTLTILLTYIYLKFNDQKVFGQNELQITFPLLGLAVTSIFLTLQHSIPLSLGLLGSLSIIRFRTPIKSPIDVGFILIVMANSLLVATRNFSTAIILVLIVWLITFFFKRKDLGTFTEAHDGNISIQMPLKESETFSLKEIDIKKFFLGKAKILSINEDEKFRYINLSVKFSENFSYDELKQKFPQGTIINCFYD